MESPSQLQFDQWEQQRLAPYAMHSANSRGRRHPEAAHPYRAAYQRDRDRVLHSAAFRRLAGKMQVFTGDRGDYHRTRLTHTMEVASIARTLGRALRLNEDLIEAMALLHDIGHPPFGHAGEDALHACLAEEGGFSHNEHALVIVEHLEERYASFPGLNLSLELLEAQTFRIDKQDLGKPPLLEAQVVDAADSITYTAHDTDDAVKLGLVTLDELAEVPLVGELLQESRSNWAGLPIDLQRKRLAHGLIEHDVSLLLSHTLRTLAATEPPSAGAAREQGWIVQPDPATQPPKTELQAFLYDRVYRHPELIAVRQEAQTQLGSMFDQFLKSPDLLPPKIQSRAEQVGIPRATGEYLAGMTDRYCQETYDRLFSGTGNTARKR